MLVLVFYITCCVLRQCLFCYFSVLGAFRTTALFMSAQQSIERAECVICFENLCSEPCAVLLTSGNKRVCRHALHARCCEKLRSEGMLKCPTCRADFRTFRTVPSMEDDPAGWFSATDEDGDGQLSRNEVLEVLKAQVSKSLGSLARYSYELTVFDFCSVTC